MQDAGAFPTPSLSCLAKVVLKDIIFPTKSNRILHVEFVVSTLLLSTNTQSHRHHVVFPSCTAHTPLFPCPTPFLQLSAAFYFCIVITGVESHFYPFNDGLVGFSNGIAAPCFGVLALAL